jgi:hypothetical protein
MNRIENETKKRFPYTTTNSIEIRMENEEVHTFQGCGAVKKL